jgi:hypothetical protein
MSDGKSEAEKFSSLKVWMRQVNYRPLLDYSRFEKPQDGPIKSLNDK